MSKVTVVGARGFIGSHVVEALRAEGCDVAVLDRGDLAGDEPLGAVVYCAGVTADFRLFPYRAVRAHAVDLMPLLERARWDRLVYLSSTRVYGLAPARTDEDAPVAIRPADPDHLYNASKVMGESLLAASRRPATILRPSNVFGIDASAGNFLAQVAREAVEKGSVTLRTARSSEKDYVGIEDVVRAIVLAASGALPEGTYNVAAGANTTHGEIVDALRELTGARIEVAAEAPSVVFPRIDVGRLSRAVSWAPRGVLAALPELVAAYRGELGRAR